MKAIIITLFGLILSLAPCLVLDRVAADGCEKSACRSGDNYDTKDGRCESGPSFFGYRSHYAPSCEEGYDLDRARGVCVKHGECCVKPACNKQYRWDRHDHRCESGPTFLGYRSHYT